MSEEVKNIFERLFKEWENLIHKPPLVESSRTKDFVNTKPYKKIVGLGNDALPSILEKIKGGQFLLNNAVFQITGLTRKDLTKEKTIWSEQEISELLIKWWDDNKKNFTTTATTTP